MTDYTKIIEDRRATAKILRQCAANEGEMAAAWLKSPDGRTRRRAERCARTAVHYFNLSLRFDATAAMLEAGR